MCVGVCVCVCVLNHCSCEFLLLLSKYLVFLQFINLFQILPHRMNFIKTYLNLYLNMLKRDSYSNMGKSLGKDKYLARVLANVFRHINSFTVFTIH